MIIITNAIKKIGKNWKKITYYFKQNAVMINYSVLLDMNYCFVCIMNSRPACGTKFLTVSANQSVI